MDASTTPAPAPASTHEDEHDSHVHVYETSGIHEADSRVPTWLMAVMVSLFVFFVGYVVVHWSAQPSSARSK